jgi:chromosome segregation ATPase
MPPKAKNPNHQQLFDIIYQFGETMCWRSQLGPDRYRKKKEMDKRAEEAKKYRAGGFPSLVDMQRREREKDEKELAYMDAQWNKYKQKWHQHTDDLAAAIYKAQQDQSLSSASTNPDVTAFMQSVEKRFESLQEKINSQASIIKDLKKGKEESDNKFRDTNARLQGSEAKVKELEEERKELNSKVQSLQQDLQKSCQRLQSLESSASKVPAQVPGKDVISLRKRVESLESLGPTVNKLVTDSDDLRKRLTRALENLDKFAVVTNNVSNLDKRVEEIAQQLQQQEELGATLAQRINDVENDVKNSQHALTQFQESMKQVFDVQELDKMFDALSTFNIKLNLPRQRDQLNSLEAQVQFLKEEIASTMLAASQANATGDAFRRELGVIKAEIKSRGASVDPKELEELKAMLNSTLTDVQSIKDSESHVAPTDPKELNELRAIASSAQNEVQSLKQSMSADTKKLASLDVKMGNATQAILTLLERINDGEKRMKDTTSTIVKAALRTVGAEEERMRKRADDHELESKQIVRDIDSLGSRMTTLENNQRIQARTPASTPRLESQPSPAASDPTMVTRVKAIEDQNLLQRMEELSTQLIQSIKTNQDDYEKLLQSVRARQDDHEKQLQQLEANMSGMRTSYDGQLEEMKKAAREILDGREADHRQVHDQLEQQQMQMQTLNHQLSHINSREMATSIVQQFDSYGPRVNARVDIVEGRIGHVEGEVDHIRGSLKQLTAKPMNGVAPSGQRVVPDKRSLPPHVNGDEANKRRRVEANGHPLPPFS